MGVPEENIFSRSQYLQKDFIVSSFEHLLQSGAFPARINIVQGLANVTEGNLDHRLQNNFAFFTMTAPTKGEPTQRCTKIENENMK